MSNMANALMRLLTVRHSDDNETDTEAEGDDTEANERTSKQYTTETSSARSVNCDQFKCAASLFILFPIAELPMQAIAAVSDLCMWRHRNPFSTRFPLFFFPPKANCSLPPFNSDTRPSVAVSGAPSSSSLRAALRIHS
jgi:hypothetical protein